MIIFGVQFEAWHLYAIAGLVFAILEVFAPGFIMLPVGIAALVTAVFAAFVNDSVAQVAFFATISLVTFFTLRPMFMKKRGVLKTNVDSMVGSEAVVIEAIDASNSNGYVKLYGDQWKAISGTGEAIDVNTRVRITRVDGNKVVVEPIV